MGPATVVFVQGDRTVDAELDPADYGIPPCEERDLAVSGPEDAARVLREVLQGQGPKPMRDMLALNLGLALYLLDEAPKSCGGKGFDAPAMARFMAEAQKAVASGAGRRFVNA